MLLSLREKMKTVIPLRRALGSGDGRGRELAGGALSGSTPAKAMTNRQCVPTAACAKMQIEILINGD